MENNIIAYGRNQYLRIFSPEPIGNLYEVRMLHDNTPPGLLPMLSNRDISGEYFDYCITDMVSLRESEGDEDLQKYLYSIIFALERLSETLRAYFLPEQQVSLLPEHIYLRKEVGEVLFCYVPGQSSTVSAELCGLMEFFLKHLCPVKEAEVLLLYGLYQKARESTVNLKSLSVFYRQAEEKKEKAEAQEEPAEKRKFQEQASERFRDAAFLSRELGIEMPKRNTEFDFEPEKREVRTDFPEESSGSSMEDDLRYFSDESGFPEKNEETGSIDDIFQEETEEIPKDADKMKSFFKNYGTELLIAVAALIVFMLVLLT